MAEWSKALDSKSSIRATVSRVRIPISPPFFFVAATMRAAMKLRPTFTDQTITLAVLAVLVVGVFLVLQPFISAIVWAAILAATVWPVFAWLRRHLSGRSGLAATVVTFLILFVVVTPFLVVGVTLAENSDRLTTFFRELVESGPPGPPAWAN